MLSYTYLYCFNSIKKYSIFNAFIKAFVLCYQIRKTIATRIISVLKAKLKIQVISP